MNDFRTLRMVSIIGVCLSLSTSMSCLADDCLYRYKQLIANQSVLMNHQAENAHKSKADQNDLQVSYILDAAKNIETGEWEFGEHTSIEMEHFFSLILDLENPQMDAEGRTGASEQSVLMGYMELAHLLNVASQKGLLCKGEDDNGNFFDSLEKIRHDIREGILPSLVSYLEEQGLKEGHSDTKTLSPGADETDCIDLEEFSDCASQLSSIGEGTVGGAVTIPLSDDPTLGPSAEERQKSRAKHFEELEDLFR